MKTDLVVIYRDVTGAWRWQYVAQNGHVLADGGQGYSRRTDAVAGAQRVTGARRGLRRRVKFVDGTPGAGVNEWSVPTFPRRYSCATCGRSWASVSAAAWCCDDDDD